MDSGPREIVCLGHFRERMREGPVSPADSATRLLGRPAHKWFIVADQIILARLFLALELTSVVGEERSYLVGHAEHDFPLLNVESDWEAPQPV